MSTKRKKKHEEGGDAWSLETLHQLTALFAPAEI